MKIAKMKLGESLVANGYIDQATLDAALVQHRSTGQRIGAVLIAMRAVTERDLTEVLSRRVSIPIVRLRELALEAGVVRLVPAPLLRKHLLVPISRAGNKLTLAMADPLDVLALDDIQLTTGFQVKAVHARPEEIQAALDLHLPEEPAPAAPPRIQELALSIFTAALERASTDIVVEPHANISWVRHRNGPTLQSSEPISITDHRALSAHVETLAPRGLRPTGLSLVGVLAVPTPARVITVHARFLPTRWGDRLTLELAPA